MLAVEENQSENLITIGELSRRTGITTHTLRIWEKRYDSPKAVRLPSGHRRYLPQEIERLRAVARVIKLGFRPGKVVGGTLEELHSLMGFESNRSSKVPPSTEPDLQQRRHEFNIDQWLDWIADFDEENLNIEFHREWGSLGPLSFITHLASPLITRIGGKWECGEFTVAHEHFATEILSTFLGDRWRRMNERKPGKTAILTTLPEENHILGLQMCAVVLSVTDWKVVSLGRNMPEEDIAAAVKQCNASLLCVSVSEWYGASRAKPILFRLRKEIGQKTKVVVGGGGAPENLAGVDVINDFNNFYQWLNDSANK
ncbi:MAG: MerR family transcriptional regulator [Nitrospinota bacterium]|nr:MerR family transcriptional regulator [Nitrospinota bacterium]